MPIAPWSETAPQLVDVAMGRTPADMLITNGRWVNVHSGEIIPGTSVAIKAGRFAAIGPDLDYTRGPDTSVIDAADRDLVPGLCDGHMHVESGMVTVTEFCRAVISLGLPDAGFGTPNGIRMSRGDPELWELMKKAGWRHLIIAPESGSQHTLQLMKKDLQLGIVPK